MRNVASALVLAVVTPFAAQEAVQGQDFDPMVRAGATEPVSEHAYVILDEGVPFVPNVGFVVGEEGVLAIDTGMGDANGAIILAEAQALAPGRDLYIVSTHYHPEHDLGAAAFPDDAMLIRSRDQLAEVEEAGAETIEQFKGFSPRVAELLDGVEHRAADLVFTDELSLDLGGVEVVFLEMGNNHTDGDIAIHVPAEGVLYAGDLAMEGKPAFTRPNSSLSQWLDSLDRLEALEPTVIVPAHGPLGEGVAFIETYRGYLADVRDAVAAQKADGLDADATVEAVTPALAEAYPDAGGRLAGAARSAYAEAE